MIQLRAYQKDAVNAAKKFIDDGHNYLLLELGTGAGKSIIISELAKSLLTNSSKKILCIAPSKELVEQNAEKLGSFGIEASIYCSSANQKCLKNNVIFATPQSLNNNVANIASLQVTAVIIDEAHRLSSTLINLIDSITEYSPDGEKKPNKNCVVMGLTATPYRMKGGYIYATDCTKGEEVIVNSGAYFNKLVYKITANELINMGYLTPVVVGNNASELDYETDGLELNSSGTAYTPESVHKVFVEGKKSKTAKIIENLLDKTSEHKGVMIFASSITHAKEITELLPRDEHCIVTGSMPKKLREEYINNIKAQKIKYIVNVDVLTTGFDSPHIDCIAVLRATESASLFQQIVGRGLRLHKDKKNCLLLDHAGNIERHNLQMDLFAPEIKKPSKRNISRTVIDIICPCCNHEMQAHRRDDKNFKNLFIDKNGYYIAAGQEEEYYCTETKQTLYKGTRLTIAGQEVPAHHLRRCTNVAEDFECEHRYSSKKCPKCDTENDICAKVCTVCGEHLIDHERNLTVDAATTIHDLPNGKVVIVPCHKAKYQPFTSSRGKRSIKAEFSTTFGKVTAYITKEATWLFDAICKVNDATPDQVSGDYLDCILWKKSPKKIRVKKVIAPARTYKYIKIKEKPKLELQSVCS